MKIFSRTAQGFHIFFPLAGLWAVLAMTAWLAIRAGLLPAPEGNLPTAWIHGHEMLFGFTAAAAAGFMLTATPVWSKTPPLTGLPLQGIAIAWLLGRAGMILNHLLPPWWPALADTIFFVGFLAFISPTLWSTGNRVHRIFPILLGLFALGDLLFHMETLAGFPTARAGLGLGGNAILFFLVMTGGHIMPMFTREALKARGVDLPFPISPALEILGAVTISLLTLADLFLPDHPLVAWTCLAAGLVQVVRFLRWHGYKTLHDPLLWVLHLGYFWLVAGLLLRGFARLTGSHDDISVRHALYVGAMGLFTLGIMSRISLLHTGRPAVAPRPATMAFLTVAIAAVIRVFLFPGDPTLATWLAGGLWIIAYALFCGAFLPILNAPAPAKPAG
ncbi:MAG: NnrS family protein [Magnetococcales bacterium]|nr:NnrS family protein [Magnetococcales bacterium]